MTASVLVVGAGSVGRRHARNLASLGARVTGFDPRPDRLDELRIEVPAAVLLHEMGHLSEFDAIVIASPPAFHVEQCIAAVDAGVPVLVEKPLAPDLEDARRLAARPAGAPVLLGYTWRWWEPLRRVRELLDDAIGEVHHVSFVLSAHLADWHPWERYQDFFMASRELGGGALLDESHWIDLLLWLFGMPRDVTARIERLSSLEIDTDDNVDLLAAFDSGLRASLHLDLYGRPHEKTITFRGEGGTIVWTAEPNRIAIGRKAEPVWEEEVFAHERNDMFLAVARELLDVVGGATPSCTIADGVDVLRVVEAARLSDRERRVVRLDEVRV